MDLRTLLRLLRDRWVSITLITILAALLAGVQVWRQTPQYSASVTLFVSTRDAGGDTSTAYQGTLLSQQKVKSYAELIRSERVLGDVAHSLGMSGGAGALAGRVSVKTETDTVLLQVTVLDPAPSQARRIADAVATRFVALVPVIEATSDPGKPTVVVSAVNPASSSPTPVSPRPVRDVGLGVFAGLLAGIGLAAARHSLDITVKSADDAGQIADAPVLGMLPRDSEAARSPLRAQGTPYSRWSEAMRKIRTSLRFIDVGRPHTVLLVTSPNAAEGKTTTACNLALSLAQSGRRVILVDAELRRSAVGTCLGLPSGVGLTSVLVGSASLREAIQVCGTEAFDVLTSGPKPPNPAELVGSPQMRDLLALLRTEYDDVIVDAPPVLPVADAAATAASCDGVVMVVHHGRTRRDQLQQAVATLRASDVPLLGLVVNRSPSHRPNSYYYGYYGYYGPQARRRGRKATPAEQASSPEGMVKH